MTRAAAVTWAAALVIASCREAAGGAEAQPATSGSANVASGTPGGAESARGAAASSAKATSPARGDEGCSPACARLERCEGGRCAPGCPEGEVFVPATGPEGFTMGRGAPGKLDQAHAVVLTRPFCMDATEVTVAAYRACVDRGACTTPQLNDTNSNFRPEYHREQHPINMVNFTQARTFCEAAGKSLPTEAQFEWAAGAGKRRYAWGDSPEPTCENGLADFTPGGTPKKDPAGDHGCHGGGTSPVGAHPKGAAVWPGGPIHDLAGNLWEWTADCYLPYPAEKVVDPSPQRHPSFQSGCYVRSLRGGGWNRAKEALQVSYRGGSKLTYRVPGLGFRCVRNP